MRYPPGLLDEIRARLPCRRSWASACGWPKAGREWKGLSPFNAEKTPSFFVNDQKGFFHDFSSGKHGDIFALRDGDGRAALPGGRGEARRACGRRPARSASRARPKSRSTAAAACTR